MNSFDEPSEVENKAEGTMTRKSKKPELGSEAVAPELWRKFHKVTPIASLGSFWIVIFVGIFSIVSQGLENRDINTVIDGAREYASLYLLLIVLGGLLLISVLVIGASAVMWKKTSFALAPNGIHHRQGVFVKKHSQIPWNRIQSVEIEQRLFGRIFGFGSVKVDAAGAHADHIELGLLRLADCSRLRKEILQALDRVRSGQSFVPVLHADSVGVEDNSELKESDAFNSRTPVQTDVWGVPSSNEMATNSHQNDIPIFDADDNENDALVYKLGTKQLIVANFFDTQVILVAFFTLMPVIGLIASGDISFFAVVLPIFAAGWNVIKSLIDDYGTKIYLSENGLRRRAGLTKVITRTVPPTRVHAIGISQPLLWRRFDWWKVVLTTADQEIKDVQNISKTFILAGTREEVLRILWTLAPDLGSDDDHALLGEALDGLDSGRFFTGAPKSARLLDPFTLRGRGVYASKKMVIIRSGRFARKVSFIMQDHTQSTMAKVGPIQRKKNLATLNVHTVLGSVGTEAKNFDRDFIEKLLVVETELARDARSEGVSESLQSWKNRMGLSKA
ncbi:PH domain-containing protein [Arcanobacterium ihumii]|uniref:PH domain-containing protein n=1 Tax=Arcanobacterium ihumii TaxID=2138162 RepID=UPI00135BD36A|nr:PH domain-containing protein [Arcanobacterium ihumii]